MLTFILRFHFDLANKGQISPSRSTANISRSAYPDMRNQKMAPCAHSARYESYVATGFKKVDGNAFRYPLATPSPTHPPRFSHHPPVSQSRYSRPLQRYPNPFQLLVCISSFSMLIRLCRRFIFRRPTILCTFVLLLLGLSFVSAQSCPSSSTIQTSGTQWYTQILLPSTTPHILTAPGM